MSRPLFRVPGFFLLFAAAAGLSLGGCGRKEKGSAGLYKGWKIILGPRVWSALEGSGRPVLRAWGPWWVPLWERTIEPGKRPDQPFRIRAPKPSNSLNWLTLEAGGKILCGALVRGGVEDFPYRIDIREVRVSLEEAAGNRMELRPLLRPRAGRTPLGFPEGGLGIDLSSRTALWVFVSPDLDLRSIWLVPRTSPSGAYCFLQADCRCDPSEWGTPAQEWGLDGDKVWRVRGNFPPGLRIFSAGFRFDPWKGPGKIPRRFEKNLFRRGLSYWSPGWDCDPARKDALLVGHSDWRRMFLLLPDRGEWGLFPLWPAAPYRGVKEDPPQAVWRLAWRNKGKRRASFQAMGIPPGKPFAGEGAGWNWAVLVIHDTGGIGKGFTSGGIALKARAVKKGAPRPFVLLETPMFTGSKARGLLFWDPASECRLEWGKGLSTLLHHRSTLDIRPGPAGLAVTETMR